MEGFLEIDWLARWAQLTPNRPALTDADSGNTTTYRDFFRIANRLARVLRDRYGVREGDRVAVLATNEIETIFLFFATQRLGAILVPLNFRLTARELTHLLSDCTPRLLIFQRQFDSLIKSIDPIALPNRTLQMDGEGGLQSISTDETLSTEVVPMAGQESSACMILYTSGTTGAPKGALITHRMLFWNSVSTGLRLNLTQNEVTLAFLPLFHTGGWNVLTTPCIHRGARVILMRKFDADRILELTEKEGLTLLFGVPTMMDMMARAPRFKATNLNSVRYAIVGGEPMPIELIRTWQARGIPVRQGFGLTEFGPNVFSLGEEDSLRKIGSIGMANFYIQTRVIDESGRECRSGEIGELLLKGPACTPGYFNNAEATAQSIRDGWFHTGDLVRVDEDGYFYVVGRRKDMFISGGENVYPAEIEQFLRSHPQVREAAVIGVPDPKWGEVGRAFLSLAQGCRLSEAEVLDYCAGNLAKYKIPKSVRFLDELPKGDSGKLLKRALIEMRD